MHRIVICVWNCNFDNSYLNLPVVGELLPIVGELLFSSNAGLPGVAQVAGDSQMKTIAPWLTLEVWVLLVALAVIIAYRMLTGSINTRGLLHDKGSGSGFSPARLQLLISTIAFGFYYIGQVVNNTQTKGFPPVPNEMLMLLGGSHVFYLGTKGFALLLETLGISTRKK